MSGATGEWGTTEKTSLHERLEWLGRLPTFENAKAILEREGRKTDTDEDVERNLNEIGFEVLYTYGECVNGYICINWNMN